MVRKLLFFAALLWLGFTTYAQPASQQPIPQLSPREMERFQIMEDSLLVNADSMYVSLLPDFRVDYCERFVKQLVRTLKMPNSWLYTFPKISKKVNIIYSDDKAFRMFNWAIMPTPATKRYYGAIQLPGEKLKLYGLLDYTEQLGKGAEDSILTGGKWFGALYYRIISRNVMNRKVYFMFGFNGGNIMSNKKVLDALTFDERGGIRFGGEYFGVASANIKGTAINRFILEYKKDVQASLNWEEEKQIIVFDRLESQIKDPLRKYTYVPTGTYDGFRWANEMWNYLRDVVPVTILKDGEAGDGN